MLLAHLSDLHITEPDQLLSDQINTAERLSRCINSINTFSPPIDLVVASGDLVQNGSLIEYQRLHSLLTSLKKPIYLIPGNHDIRENLRKVFIDHHYFEKKSDFLQFVVEDYPVRIIGMDSVIPGSMGGELCHKRLSWLEQLLKQQPKRPTVVLLHHPPFKIGITAMDLIKCETDHAFAEIIRQHPEVKRVLCGHVHRAITHDWGNTIAMCAPAVSAQLKLELNVLSPEIIIPWSAHEGPAFLLHHYTPEMGIVSHHVQIP